MKKLIIVIVSLLVAVNAHASASWVFVGTSEDKSDFYVDINSIQKQGDSVVFWMRLNYNQKQSSDVLSVKMQDTINCPIQLSTSVYMMAYDDINNKGSLIASFETGTSWKPIQPDSVNWDIMKLVCK